MRRLLILLLLCSPAWGTVAYVQSGKNTSCNGTTCSPSPALSNLTAGSTVVVIAQSDSNRLSSVTASCATFTVPTGGGPVTNGAAGTVAIYVAKNVSGGCSNVVLNFSPSDTGAIAVLEYSGADTAAPVDVINSGTGSSTICVASAILTPSNANEMFVSSCSTGSSQSGWSATDGTWTKRLSANYLVTQDKLVTGTTGQRPVLSLSSLTGDWVAFLLALQPPTTTVVRHRAYVQTD